MTTTDQLARALARLDAHASPDLILSASAPEHELQEAIRQRLRDGTLELVALRRMLRAIFRECRWANTQGYS